MRLFCPNCGADNEGRAGTRITCRACAATFDAPRGEAPVPQSATPADSGWAADTAQPSRPQAPPAPTFSAPVQSPAPVYGATTTSPLAIASLVTGILCCLPFPIAALVTGFLALKQIDQSQGSIGGRGLAIAGIVLGFLALGVNCLGIIGQLAQR